MMTLSAAFAVGLAVVGFAAGPPKLPDLPRRGMRTPPAETPAAETPPAESTPTQPRPSSQPSPPTQPETPTEPKTVARPAVPVQRAATPTAGAVQASLGPLPTATEADYAAWASDDARAAAPLRSAEPLPAAAAHVPGDRPAVAAHAAASDYGDMQAVVVRRAQPEPDPTPRFRRAPGPPQRSATVVLSYRNFTLRDALGRRQAWHMGSIEVTPFRRYFRLNFLTEAGVEGGDAARAGDRADFMIVQKVGVGLQYPHWVTPFIETQGGIGLARLEVFERNDLGLTWTLGVDAGAQWAVTQWLSLHAAIGWLHPVIRTSSTTVQFDRVAFKVGIGF